MNDWTLLSDDHALLRAQLTRVITLLNLVQSGSYSAQHLHHEILRQAELWKSQQSEHFSLEESSVFPQIENLDPARAPRVARLITEHKYLLDSFAKLVAELALPWSESDVSERLASAREFEQQFEQHATAESQLFDEVAVQVNQSSHPEPERE